jgi:Mn2+ and Fe2+ transporters of the NRAMP family
MEKIKRYLWLGPAVIVSVAYIDPGNFGSNLAAGSKYGLQLLWIVWLAGIMAIFFQYLSGKIGIATKKSITDIVFQAIEKRFNNNQSIILRYFYFLPLFVMVLATDMAEFLGIILGIYLLFSIPLVFAIWISIIDVLIIMFLSEKFGFERIIGLFIGIVGISFIYELYIVQINPVEILFYSFTPTLSEYGHVLLAASIIGATVMPHAVILHSHLTSEKFEVLKINIFQFLKKHKNETIIFLALASLVNASLQIMSYYAFGSKGYDNIDVEIAYKILEPLYGIIAANIFAIALLFSGISSSMVSVLAGQKLVESCLKIKTQAWKVRLIVRLINMVPIFIALIILGLSPIEILVYSQVILSLTLPFVLIPLVLVSSNKKYMNELTNIRITSFLSFTFSIIIIAINFSLIYLWILGLTAF